MDTPLSIKNLKGDLRQIAAVIGVEPAMRLSRAFGGNFMYISTLDSLNRKERDIRIRQDYDGGISIKVLSRKYSLTERTILRVLNRA
jgi:Mor family transcriptional regulator